MVITPPVDAAARPNDTIQPNATNLVGQPSLNVSTAFSKANGLIAQLTETARRSDKLIDALTQTAVSTNQIIQGPDDPDDAEQSDPGVHQRPAADAAAQRGPGAGQRAGADPAAADRVRRAKWPWATLTRRRGSSETLATENRAKLNEIVSDLQDTTASVSGITGQLNESFKEGQVPKNLAAIVANMKTASDNLVVISNNFQKLSADQGLQGDLRETLHNVRASTEQTTYLLERLNQIAGTKPHSTVVVAPRRAARSSSRRAIRRRAGRPRRGPIRA